MIAADILDRLGVDALFERFVPTETTRCRLPWAKGLGVLLRSILVEREPIYRQHEMVAAFAPASFRLTADEMVALGDDQIGRALDHLFDADRGSFLTEVVISASKAFGLTLDELHNDSTSLRLVGQYRRATGRTVRGKVAPFITYGYSKDHRPDLKQILFVLTTAADGGVPIQFRSEPGNKTDSRTHEETWDTLCKIAGNTTFLYVADSKLCGGEAMDHIDSRKGRFVTVMPRSRRKDATFREWIQTNEPPWETVRDRRHPRRHDGPRDIWRVFVPQMPSKEGWPIVWVSSALLRLKQERSRQERVTRAEQLLQRLATQLSGPKPRHRTRPQIELRIGEILKATRTARYLVVNVTRKDEHTHRQDRAGRPGPDTRYRRRSKTRWCVSWTIDQTKVAYDRKSDGMYPLLTNDRTLTARQALDAHKRQPTIEKRFEQTKSVFEVAPIFLKNETRIDALLFIYFLSILVQTLLEREVRRAMARLGMETLPIYPEERRCHRPTAEQLLRVFAPVQRHVLVHRGADVRAFDLKLTETQRLVLGVLGIPDAYRLIA